MAPRPAPNTLTSAALGSLSASLTASSRTLDEYSALAKQELNHTKQEKALCRLRGFYVELADDRAQFGAIKSTRDNVVLYIARTGASCYADGLT